MPSEFPKPEQVSVKKREVFEEHLPAALQAASALFLHERKRDAHARYQMTRELSKQDEYYALGSISAEKISERLLARFRESHDPLELVALFDVAAGERETDMHEARFKINNASARDPQGKERAASDLGRFTRDHNELAHYRDQLIEDAPDLRVEMRKEFFIDWVKRSLDVFERMLKGSSRSADEKDMIRTEYDILDAVYVGRPRGTEENGILLEMISRSLGKARQTVSGIISQSIILGRKEFDRARLLRAQQEIILFRNFQANVEGAEW